ncbi:MAG: Gfo/Idh/MocA family protein [Candidatus Methylacidiphilales bacterium]|nr:Gfo/Idh/MocA family oxidoreductase [Candidatus Methylacidiphilales bacterium]
MSLKTGIVGLRGIGQNHVRCHQQDSLSDLVAVCDAFPGRAAEVAAGLPGVKAYTRLRDMLDAHPELQVVDVCTGGYENGGWHFEPAMEAMAAGKHVLVEKPISNDINEAREMVRFAREKDRYLGCNLNHYFSPPAQEARRLMDSGEIGEQIYCLHRMGFIGGDATYNPAGGGGPNFSGFPYAHLKAFLAHPFSLLRYFCGDITHVQAFMDRPALRKNNGDAMLSIASIHVRFMNGCTGYLFSSRGDVTMGLGGWWSFELGGTKGTFTIENCVEKVTYYPTPKPGEKYGLGEQPAARVTESGVKDFNSTFPTRIHAFLEDVTNKVPKDKLRASGRDALATLEYTFAAIESHEQGGALVRPHPLPTAKRDVLDQ